MSRGKMAEAQPAVRPKSKDQTTLRRLYPVLPNVDSYDVCVPAGEIHPGKRLEDPQGEPRSATGDDRVSAECVQVLKGQRDELRSINEKWASEYQATVQHYTEKVRDLKVLLQSYEKAQMYGGKQQRNSLCETPDDDAQAVGDDVNPELEKAEKEVKVLREQNAALTQKGLHQQEEIKRLNRVLEEALLPSANTGADKQTQLDIWKHQANVYKEDFLIERKDREELKGEYLEMESKFLKVRQELRDLKSQCQRNNAEFHPLVARRSSRNAGERRRAEVDPHPSEYRRGFLDQRMNF